MVSFTPRPFKPLNTVLQPAEYEAMGGQQSRSRRFGEETDGSEPPFLSHLACSLVSKPTALPWLLPHIITQFS